MVIFSVVVAFVIAFLSGLGIGGGGLFATYLAMFTPLPQLSVQGFNLIFFLFCACSSVIVQILVGRRIRVGAVLIMVISGLVGACAGAFLSIALPQEYLRRIFGMMLVATGLVALGRLYSKNRSTDTDTEKNNLTDRNGKNGEK